MENGEKLSQSLELEDGRSLGYAEVGKPGTQVLFWFHGGGSSRFEIKFLEEIAIDRSIHVIAPDRPGMGLSSFQKERSITEGEIEKHGRCDKCL